jgi:multimeric flavodoxin WrbA
MYAAPKKDYPIATLNTLREYDGILFGIPTRYGNFPGQWKVSFHLYIYYNQQNLTNSPRLSSTPLEVSGRRVPSPESTLEFSSPPEPSEEDRSLLP